MVDRSGGGEAQHEEEHEEEKLVHGGRGLACVELLEGSVKGAECESVRRGGGAIRAVGLPERQLVRGGRRDGKTQSVHGSCGGGGGLSFTLSVAPVASGVVAEAGKGQWRWR